MANLEKRSAVFFISDVKTSPLLEKIIESLKNFRTVYLFSMDEQTSHFLNEFGKQQESTSRQRIVFLTSESYPIIIFKLIQIRPALVLFSGHVGLVKLLIICRLARFKKLYVIRHYASQHAISGQLRGLIFDKIVNNLATKLIAVSGSVRDRLIEEKVKSRKITVINNSIQLDEFANLRHLRSARKNNCIYPRTITVGMIGRTSYVKGYSRLPWILSMLDFKLRAQKTDTQVIFEIVGATGDLENLDNEISKITLQKVKIKRIKHHEDIFRKLVAWDIFLHIPINEKAEGFGLVYIEALASGIPSIFLKSGILNEFIPKAESVSILDCKQWLQIPDKIIYFINTMVKEIDIKELEQFRMSRLMGEYTQVFDAN